MSKIKVSELKYSIQGEGRYMGIPSIVLRTHGCNFKCSGFGMLPEQTSIEADDIATQHQTAPYAKYENLPLTKTGCDSFATWHPALANLSPMLSTDTIADRCRDLLPGGTWQDTHLVITGGEPLLGWQKSYLDLLTHPFMYDLKELTFETNGTQWLEASVYNFLKGWLAQNPERQITFSVSPKLSNSGESHDDAIQPKIVAEYQEVGYTYLKFVVAADTDVEEIEGVVDEYRKEGFKGPVYLMPLGGVKQLYSNNNNAVAEMALRRGWRYSDRLQVSVLQ